MCEELLNLLRQHRNIKVKEESLELIVEFKSSRILVITSKAEDTEGFYRYVEVTIITYIYIFIFELT